MITLLTIFLILGIVSWFKTRKFLRSKGVYKTWRDSYKFIEFSPTFWTVTFLAFVLTAIVLVLTLAILSLVWVGNNMP